LNGARIVEKLGRGITRATRIRERFIYLIRIFVPEYLENCGVTKDAGICGVITALGKTQC
jgi:hypothetical protein